MCRLSHQGQALVNATPRLSWTEESLALSDKAVLWLPCQGPFKLEIQVHRLVQVFSLSLSLSYSLTLSFSHSLSLLLTLLLSLPFPSLPLLPSLLPSLSLPLPTLPSPLLPPSPALLLSCSLSLSLTLLLSFSLTPSLPHSLTPLLSLSSFFLRVKDITMKRHGRMHIRIQANLLASFSRRVRVISRCQGAIGNARMSFASPSDISSGGMSLTTSRSSSTSAKSQVLPRLCR